MRLSKSWDVASKDFATFSRKRNIIYTVFIVPILVSILLPAVVEYVVKNSGGGATPAELAYLLPSFTFFYMILAGLAPTTIAAYSIVGEKVEKCFEPLLATPMTDSEILLGKGIAAFAPPIAAILAGASIFMGLMDAVTYGVFGYNFFPNGNAAVVFFLMVPLAAIMSVEWNIIVSARVSDVRIATQVGMLLILPFAGIYVGGELGVVPLGDITDLLLIAAALLVLDLLLLFVASATFRREEILTKWR